MSCIFCTDEGICLLKRGNCNPEECINPIDIGIPEEDE